MRPRPAVLSLGALFIVYHLAATLTNTAPPAIREPLWPLFDTYGAELRMTARFGVFGRYTKDTSVAVYAVSAAGERQLLSHTSPARRSAADARITKIQRKFIQQETRDLFGQAYLDYYCRTAAVGGLSAQRVELWLEPAQGNASAKLVLSRNCRTPHE